MNVIIHDLNDEDFKLLFPKKSEDVYVVSNNGNIKNCIGCFGCWIKTPGKCVIKDGYDNIGALFAKADNIIIISKCCYGGYSPFVKNVLDRSISYMLPFFKTINNETHHKQRYNKSLALSVYFYGEDITGQEKKTVQDMVKANCINFNINNYKVDFCLNYTDIREKVSAI